MSEFKYACPHCGQHIRCDAAQSGTIMECPTCFQKIVAPQAPAVHDPKFILTGSKLPKQRPIGTAAGGATVAPVPANKFPVVALVVVLLVAAVAAAAFVFRDKIFKPASAPGEPKANDVRREVVPVTTSVGSNAQWKLDLEAEAFPEAPAAGRLNGQEFKSDRAILLGGLLTLRQGGQGGPPDLGVTIGLHAVRSADLAGKTIVVTTNQSPVPKVTLRSKDAAQKRLPRPVNSGYALRLEFGALAGSKLPGKIYLCLPDDQQSYVAGNFTAEIIKPKPPTKPVPAKK